MGGILKHFYYPYPSIQTQDLIGYNRFGQNSLLFNDDFSDYRLFADFESIENGIKGGHKRRAFLRLTEQ
jgi:hypothetical protein